MTATTLNGLVDVLDLALSEVFERRVELAADVIEHGAGNADITRIGEPAFQFGLQERGDYPAGVDESMDSTRTCRRDD